MSVKFQERKFVELVEVTPEIKARIEAWVADGWNPKTTCESLRQVAFRAGRPVGQLVSIKARLMDQYLRQWIFDDEDFSFIGSDSGPTHRCMLWDGPEFFVAAEDLEGALSTVKGLMTPVVMERALLQGPVDMVIYTRRMSGTTFLEEEVARIPGLNPAAA